MLGLSVFFVSIVECYNRCVCFAPGGLDLIDRLLKDEQLSKQKAAVKGLEELRVLLEYCEIYNVLNRVRS